MSKTAAPSIQNGVLRMEENKGYATTGQWGFPAATAPVQAQPQLDQQQIQLIQQRLRAERQLRSGANWFYWIAGLSLINTVIAMAGNDWQFFAGLGIAELIDAFMRIYTQIALAGAVLDLSIAGAFVAFAYFAGKRHIWAFVAGMTIYAMDGLLLLALGSPLSLLFHAFALYGLLAGLIACRKLGTLQAQTTNMPALTNWTK